MRGVRANQTIKSDVAAAATMEISAAELRGKYLVIDQMRLVQDKILHRDTLLPDSFPSSLSLITQP
jgi:hypothetical protein